MSYSMLNKCGTCGHQRQHHVFPSWKEPSGDRFDKPSRDPGCMLGHPRRNGTVKNPEWNIPLRSSTGEKCPCEVFSE